MMFSLGTILGTIGSLLGGVVSSVGNSFLGALASGIEDACLSITKLLATFWVNVGTAGVSSSPGSSTPSTPVAFTYSHLGWYIGAFCLLSVIVGVIRMIFEQRAAAGYHLLRGILVFIAVSAMAVTVISLLVDAADQFSTWILTQSLNVPAAQAGSSIATGLANALTVQNAGSELMLAIVVGLIAAVGSLIQVALLIIRSAMLILLTGALPLTFSLWSTDTGKQWSKKAVAWLLAFILYKPAAAIIYALAFQLLAEGHGVASLGTTVTGVAMLFMAIIAMPALMRFIVPATGAIASGGAGMLLGAAGAAAAAAALPRGAVALKTLSGGTNGSGGVGSAPAGAKAAAGFAGQGATAAAGAGAGVAVPATAVLSVAGGVARGAAQAAEPDGTGRQS